MRTHSQHLPTGARRVYEDDGVRCVLAGDPLVLRGVEDALPIPRWAIAPLSAALALLPHVDERNLTISDPHGSDDLSRARLSIGEGVRHPVLVAMGDIASGTPLAVTLTEPMMRALAVDLEAIAAGSSVEDLAWADAVDAPPRAASLAAELATPRRA